MKKSTFAAFIEILNNIRNWGKQSSATQRRTMVSLRLEILEDRVVPADYWWRPAATLNNIPAPFAVAANWQTAANNGAVAANFPGAMDTVHIDSQSLESCLVTGTRSIGALDIVSPNVDLGIQTAPAAGAGIAPPTVLLVTGLGAENVALPSTLDGATINNNRELGRVPLLPGVLTFQGAVNIKDASFARVQLITAGVTTIGAGNSGGNMTFSVGSSFRNSGQLVWNGNGTIQLNSRVKIVNSGTFTIAGNGTVAGVAGIVPTEFSNLGTVIMNGDGTATIGQLFTNRGVLQINSGTLALTDTQIGGSTVLNGGTLQGNVSMGALVQVGMPNKPALLAGRGTVIGNVTPPAMIVNDIGPNGVIHPGVGTNPGILRARAKITSTTWGFLMQLIVRYSENARCSCN